MEQGNKYCREIVSDILAIGGGGAGSMAAVAAARGGAKTVLVVKSQLGRSGNTIMAGASFSMDGESAKEYGYDGDSTFTKDVWFREIVQQGFYLSDQRMVEKFVEKASACVKQVVEWGERAGQFFYFYKPGGFFTSGKAIGLALRRGVKEQADIEVIEDVMITDILTRDGRCVGAVGIDIYSGEAVLFKSKAVVLGTGGFQPFSFKCTNSDMTGDGLGMALRAGASLADMEFPLFTGAFLSPLLHRGNTFPFIYSVLTGFFPTLPIPVVMNAQGEDVSQKIPPDHLALAVSSEWSKLVYSYWWGKEIASGHGSPNGGLYFSFKHIPNDVFLNGVQVLIDTLKIWYGDSWRYLGEDMSDLKETVLAGNAWEVGLTHEYSNGGVAVNEKAETEIPGLYAAGECSTGCFGALRIHDALVEMLVQGYIAGEEAAESSKNTNDPKIDTEQLDAHIERILAPLERKSGVSPVEIRGKLEEAADSGFGYLRNEESIRNALTVVESIRTGMVPEMAVKSKSRSYNPEWIESICLGNLTLCLEAGLKAALDRKESRGTHIREDYPQVDHDNYLIRFLENLVDGEMTISTRKPVVTNLDLPTGKAENVMAYALSFETEFKYSDVDVHPEKIGIDIKGS